MFSFCLDVFVLWLREKNNKKNKEKNKKKTKKK
jgi:hypothetical protein